MLSLDIEDIYNDDFTLEVETYRNIVSGFIEQTFIKYFVESGLTEKHTYDEMIAPEFFPSVTACRYTKKILDFFIDRGNLKVTDAGKIKIQNPIIDRDPEDKKLNEFLKEKPERTKFYGILQNIRSVMGDVLLKGEDALLLLSGDDFKKSMDFWEELNAYAPVKLPCHQLVLRTLKNKFKEQENVTIFEGGAGVGAIMREIAEDKEIIENMDKISSYYYTDISLSLIKLGREFVRNQLPADFFKRIVFKTVDMDKLEISGDGTTIELKGKAFLEAESVDVVILEHVLYNLTDLHKSLQLFHHMLKPDGLLIFTMAYRHRPKDFFMFEYMQASFQSYNTTKLDPPYRKNAGYLTLDEWKSSLSRANYKDLEIYPNEKDHVKWTYGGIIARPLK
ncbi:MAG: class I SAM-dependent methyltransferase [Proteobacteria bacterium]|nr:class I SAM-dependent methyltransferase [Pseudomonadota bacterium]